MLSPTISFAGAVPIRMAVTRVVVAIADSLPHRLVLRLVHSQPLRAPVVGHLARCVAVGESC